MIEERTLTLRTPDGVFLESRAAEPSSSRGGVVIAHPHPLYGGDMENPVVGRAVEVCAGLGVTTLRFNFRGVGGSTGRHGDGIAERIDVETALDHVQAMLGAGAAVALVGYSFGAMVAAQVAPQRPGLSGLCLIAPPLRRAALPPALASSRASLGIVAGTRDEYCPADEVDRLRREFTHARVASVAGADHFFLGKLVPLGEAIALWAHAVFPR